MRSIFFDLETSDKEPCGQIVNFSFIALSESWHIEDELSGEVRLSRLQIPSPGALLANRVRVMEHQERATYTEREASLAIATFLDRIARDGAGNVALIGYNSFRFDLPYIRTTLIRNGVNPYVGGGRIINRDLFAAARKLSVTNPKFPRVKKESEPPKEGEEKGPRLSLTLETIAKSLGVLEGAQLHSSRDDVLITIEVAKIFAEQFGLDVRSYDSYEAIACHHAKSKGRSFISLEPQYDLTSPEIAQRTPMTLLDFDRRYSLWVNLTRFAAGEGRKSVQFYKNQGSSFVIDTLKSTESELEALAQKAAAELAGITLGNFFQRSGCDVEVDIFRVDFDGINALGAALWRNDKEAVKKLNSRDVTALYVRNILANHSWGKENDAAIREKLKSYAQYRYGGAMQISKNQPTDEGSTTRYHPTLQEIEADLAGRLEGASGEDREILLSLAQYIQASEIRQYLKP